MILIYAGDFFLEHSTNVEKEKEICEKIAELVDENPKILPKVCVFF